MSAFDHIHDLLILGGGCVGHACARKAADAGWSVLLLEPRGDHLWEFGRAFAAEAGTSDDPTWQALMAEAASRDAVADGHVAGATLEVLACRDLKASTITVLSYAWPLALESHDSSFAALVVATKDGPRRLRARRFCDASDSGLLLRLAGMDPDLRPANPEAVAHFRSQNWGDDPRLRTTATGDERLLRFTTTGDAPPWRQLPELLQAHADILGDALLTHCSWQALPRYTGTGQGLTRSANLLAAVPGLSAGPIATPADRWNHGVAAWQDIQTLSAAAELPADTPLPAIPANDNTAAVTVIGLGTGGAVAALAAARAGATTIGIDPLPFPGGIGTGGGIHAYFYGVDGGVQTEINRATMQLTEEFPAFRATNGNARWHHLAKAIVLDRMMVEAGVDVRYGCVLAAIEQDRGRIEQALVATEKGPQRIHAHTWIDGSGDGDCCRLAGAEVHRGRDGDGGFHAYSQSSGRVVLQEKGYSLPSVNYDAGWCDPSSSESLSDARLLGIAQYEPRLGDGDQQPTHIAPALGLRQGDQIVCDHQLTFDELIMGTRFDDEISYGGANIDNHATDCHWESDEGLFWNWMSRNWHTQTTCGISYRCILPRGISNCLIASRCLGVSQDASYAIRMMRDMQRLGEAAGVAAALCAQQGLDCRTLPIADLRAALGSALDLPTDDHQAPFGGHADLRCLRPPGRDERIAAGLTAIDDGSAGRPLWWLLRERAACETAVLERLASADDRVSWFAACVVAAWGDARAEARLLRAIREREYGHDTNQLGRNQAPNWLAATGLLRCCGTPAALPVLEDLLAAADHSLQTRCVIALSLGRIHERTPLNEERLAQMAAGLRAPPIPATSHRPNTHHGHDAQRCLLGDPPPEHDAAIVSEDHSWQLERALSPWASTSPCLDAVVR